MSFPYHRIAVPLLIAGGLVGQIPRANFVAQKISVSSGSLTPQRSVTITTSVGNSGGQATPRVTSGVYLSSDRTITRQDMLITQWQLPPIGAFRSVKESHKVTLPANLPGGRQQLALFADSENRIFELSEGDNIAQTTVTCIARPDLRVAQLTVDSFVNRGKDAELQCFLENVGGTTTGVRFRVGVYLSDDATLSRDDELVTTYLIPPIRPGLRPRIQGEIRIPEDARLGERRLLVVADDLRQVREASENNNTAARTVRVQHLGAFRDIGRACAGAAKQVARGQQDRPPAIGTRVFYKQAMPSFSFFALLAVGFSKERYGPIRLPFVWPGTNCSVFSSHDLIFPVVTLFPGLFSKSFTIPEERSLITRKIYTQYVNFDPAANAAGFTMSQSIETEIGGM